MIRAYSFVILFLLITGKIYAQVYPVQATVQVLPPYSLYLTDYQGDNLIVNLFLKDASNDGLQVKLRLIIEGENGVKLTTKPDLAVPPITLTSNMPVQLSGIDLQAYLNPENMTVEGIDYAYFMRTKRLPEGLYYFKVEAIEYRRNKLVSNTGVAIAWLILNDPPVWNLPQNNSIVEATNPQHIFFSWTSRHIGSPNSAFATEYEFSLYDIIPQDRNAEDVVNTSIPIYQTTTMSNNLIYGQEATPLVPGRKYACRLRAYDTEGRDLFKNDGYSAVLVFTYGQECHTPVSIHEDISSPFEATVHWTSVPGNTDFEVAYREKEANSRWYYVSSETSSAVLRGLKPEHTYEYKVKGICGTIESNYSELYEFETPAKEPDTSRCENGGGVPPIDTTAGPLARLYVGDVINVGGYEGVITQASGSNGVFSGRCIMRVTNFNILLKSHFRNIHINDKYQVTAGRIIADRGPGSIIDIDDLGDLLDSLANVDLDSIDTTGYINTLDSIIYDIPPDSVTNFEYSIEQIIDNSEEILDSGNLSDEEEDKLEEIISYLEDLLNQIDEPDKPNNSGYYFLIDNDTTKYYEVYYTMQRNDSIKIKFFYNDTLCVAQEWKDRNTLLKSNSDSVMVEISQDRILKIKVNNKKIKFYVKTYKSPVVNFETDQNTYNGEFGFDNYFNEFEELKKHNFYETFNFYEKTYYVPWLTLLKGQTVNIYVTFKGNNRMQYDKNFKLSFVSTDTSVIKCYFSNDSIFISSLTNTIKTDNRFELTVEGKEADSMNYYDIRVNNQINNLTGKLKIACMQPVTKNISFLYVKINPNSNLPDTATILNFLNNNAFNQAFIKWETFEKFNGTTIYAKRTDTLDFTTVYNRLKPMIDTMQNIDKKHEVIDDTIISEYLLKINRRKLWSETNYLIITDIPISDSKVIVKGFSYLSKKNTGPVSFLYLNNDEADYLSNATHELGHLFKLFHIFKDNGSANRGWWLEKGNTNNFMDYDNDRKSFYFFQWQIMNPNRFPNP